jgi:hypothetical protein
MRRREIEDSSKKPAKSTDDLPLPTPALNLNAYIRSLNGDMIVGLRLVNTLFEYIRHEFPPKPHDFVKNMAKRSKILSFGDFTKAVE